MNIAFIPVRGGSKSIPLKNIKILNGKPLVYWTTKAANDADCVDKVIIATDSDEIKNVVQNFDLSKVEIFDRNPENATDTASTESVMLEFISQSNLNPEDNFFLIQATSPLLKSEHIENMYKKFLTSGADSIVSGVVEKRNRPRRQEFEGLVAENGACYINSVGNILRDKCRLSGRINFFELPSYTAYEIDEEEDWLIIEALMKQYN